MNFGHKNGECTKFHAGIFYEISKAVYMFFKLFRNLKYQALCSSILIAIQCLIIKCHKNQGLTHKFSHKISHFFVFLRKVIIFKNAIFSKKKLKKLKKNQNICWSPCLTWQHFKFYNRSNVAPAGWH